MTPRRLACVLCGLLAASSAPVALGQSDHPFTLVNVIDLFDVFTMPIEYDETFDPGSPPPNYAEYIANPRVGTNPAAIVVDGDRVWISGFNNNATYIYAGTDGKRLAWYTSLGIAEVGEITAISGYGAPYVKYMDSFQFGPAVTQTDSFTGLDYDPIHKILYAAFDDTLDVFSGLPASADPQQVSYLAAFDADPDSPTYMELLWKLEDPLNPPQFPWEPGDRYYAGLAVDPFDGGTIVVPQTGGKARVFNTFDPLAQPTILDVKDFDLECAGVTFYRAVSFDGVTGDLYLRNANATQWLPRDILDTGSPFTPQYEFIEEPEGGDGVASTGATGDDEQLIAVDESADAGDNIIGPGPNGVIDTFPAGDDKYDLVAFRPIGNTDLPDDDGSCNDHPESGYGNGPFGQGQGVAVVSASNVVGLEEDLILANNRKTFGHNQLTDLRFFNLDREEIAQLEIPCSPVPSTEPPVGIAYYDADYDEASGTLVVSSFEERWLYVFKTQIEGGPAYQRFDYTRNGTLDLHDFAGFQECYNGEGGGGLTLNCMRVNTGSDCDIDYEDWLIVSDMWEGVGGP